MSRYSDFIRKGKKSGRKGVFRAKETEALSVALKLAQSDLITLASLLPLAMLYHGNRSVEIHKPPPRMAIDYKYVIDPTVLPE